MIFSLKKYVNGSKRNCSWQMTSAESGQKAVPRKDQYDGNYSMGLVYLLKS